jgi:hypothetical protein
VTRRTETESRKMLMTQSLAAFSHSINGGGSNEKQVKTTTLLKLQIALQHHCLTVKNCFSSFDC